MSVKGCLVYLPSISRHIVLFSAVHEFAYEGHWFHSQQMCRQLDDLQSKYQAERLEGDKIRQLLVYEETRRCDLEGSLDQAQKHARDQQRSLHNQVSGYILTMG